MTLPKESLTDKKLILKQLNEIYNLEKKKSYWYKFKKWYYRHNKVVWIYFLFLIIILGVILLIVLLSVFIQIKIDFKFDISFVLIVYASFISTITLLINFMKIMDYPIAEFKIIRCNSKENYYELEFSINNAGHGKLKLLFAAYFIEEYKRNSKLDAFLYCDTENIDQYFDELLNRIKGKVIKVYSLRAITKDFGVFFPHIYKHTESRLHRFNGDNVYTITFFFQTSHRIFYYVIKHFIP